MIYADTDFFLALIKPSDWLQKKAVKLYRKHKGNIVTHAVTILELVLVCRREEIPVQDAVHEVFRIAHVEGMQLEQALTATELIEERKMTPFDAFHVALSGDRPILSSDKAYDRVGKERLSLDKT